MLEWMSRTALELIGQGGLGYSFDPLVEDIDNSLGDAMKALVYVGLRVTVYARLTISACESWLSQASAIFTGHSAQVAPLRHQARASRVP